MHCWRYSSHVSRRVDAQWPQPNGPTCSKQYVWHTQGQQYQSLKSMSTRIPIQGKTQTHWINKRIHTNTVYIIWSHTYIYIYIIIYVCILYIYIYVYVLLRQGWLPNVWWLPVVEIMVAQAKTTESKRKKHAKGLRSAEWDHESVCSYRCHDGSNHLMSVDAWIHNGPNLMDPHAANRLSDTPKGNNISQLKACRQDNRHQEKHNTLDKQVNTH